MRANSLFDDVFGGVAAVAGLGWLWWILKAVLILVGGIVIIRVAGKVVGKALTKTSLDAAVHTFILSALKIGLWVLLIVVLLSYFNVPTAPLVTVLGACGAAIALALKDSLSNIAGGLLILANKPFGKGDVIDTAGIQGVVEHIDLFATTLKTVDNKVITVPNGTINTSVIVNYSREDLRRVDCRFSVSYDTDLTRAKDVLLAVAKSCADIKQDPAPFVGVASHGESAVLLDLRVWCDTPKYWDVTYYLQEQVKVAFDEAKIDIPFPQVDVHVEK